MKHGFHVFLPSISVETYEQKQRTIKALWCSNVSKSSSANNHFSCSGQLFWIVNAHFRHLFVSLFKWKYLSCTNNSKKVHAPFLKTHIHIQVDWDLMKYISIKIMYNFQTYPDCALPSLKSIASIFYTLKFIVSKYIFRFKIGHFWLICIRQWERLLERSRFRICYFKKHTIRILKSYFEAFV